MAATRKASLEGGLPTLALEHLVGTLVLVQASLEKLIVQILTHPANRAAFALANVVVARVRCAEFPEKDLAAHDCEMMLLKGIHFLGSHASMVQFLEHHNLTS